MIKTTIGKETYFIKGDKSQWTIGKITVAKSGENKGNEVFTGEYFYTTLEGMLKNLLERKVRCSDSNTLCELREAIKTAKDELVGMYEL